MHTLHSKYVVFAGSVWFASEMKALSDDCERFITFPPGHIYSSKQGMLNSSWTLGYVLGICVLLLLPYHIMFNLSQVGLEGGTIRHGSLRSYLQLHMTQRFYVKLLKGYVSSVNWPLSGHSF